MIPVPSGRLKTLSAVVDGFVQVCRRHAGPSSISVPATEVAGYHRRSLRDLRIQDTKGWVDQECSSPGGPAGIARRFNTG